MANHIIEYIGKEGVKTTPYNIRILHPPKPGDVIFVPETLIKYPFKKWNMIQSVNKEKDEVYLCCGAEGSFLGKDWVSISGGPWTTVSLKSLKQTNTLKECYFWNWGDNLPGAHQGVYYKIERPVFELCSIA